MKWVKRLFGGLVVLLVVIWFGVPLLVGTSWAKERIRTAIAEETGRDVTLGSVSFGWLSGLEVRDVRVAQKPGDLAEEGPLFELSSLDVKVGIGEVLRKHVDVEELHVVDPRIVIVRNADGSLNFSDLLEKPGKDAGAKPPTGGAPPTGGKGSGRGAPPVTARLSVEGGRILFIDRMKKTRVEAGDIAADAFWKDGRLDIDMTCELNGGRMRLLANADLASAPAALHVEELTVDGSEFSSELAQLGHFLPLLGEKPERASGRLVFEVRDLDATGLDADSLTKSLKASGKISLSGGILASGPLTEVFGSLGQIGVTALDSLWAKGEKGAVSMDVFRSTFSVKDGKIHSEDMTLEAAGLEFRLSGWTRLDGKIKYQMQIANLAEVLGAEGALEYALKDGVLPVDLKGRLSDPKVEFDLKDAAKERIRKELGGRLGEGLGGILKDLGDEEKKR